MSDKLKNIHRVYMTLAKNPSANIDEKIKEAIIGLPVIDQSFFLELFDHGITLVEKRLSSQLSEKKVIDNMEISRSDDGYYVNDLTNSENREKLMEYFENAVKDTTDSEMKRELEGSLYALRLVHADYELESKPNKNDFNSLFSAPSSDPRQPGEPDDNNQGCCTIS